MICVTPNGTALEVVACTTPGAYALMTVEEATGQDLQALGVTPEAVTQVWAWGFGAVMLLWGIGYAVNAGKRLINKI